MEGKKGHWRIFFFDKFSTASKLLRVTQNDHRWSQTGQAKPGQTNPNIRIQITLWGNPSSTVSHMFSDLSPFDLHLMFKIPQKEKLFWKGLLVHEASAQMFQERVWKMHNYFHEEHKTSRVTRRGVGAREEVRLNMQLLQKDAWVMKRPRSGELVHIHTNLIQSHYFTGTSKVLTVVVEDVNTT